MKVKALRTIAGPWGTWGAGEIADLPDDVAKAIVLARAGELVEDAPRVETPAEVKVEAVYETAAVEAPETEEYPPRRRRKA